MNMLSAFLRTEAVPCFYSLPDQSCHSFVFSGRPQDERALAKALDSLPLTFDIMPIGDFSNQAL
jgi:hypothetical protein